MSADRNPIARHVTFTAACLALNLGLGKVSSLLSLPVAFDTVGTILAAALLPWPFVLVVAVGSSLLGGLVINPVFPFYVGTQLAIALAAILAAHYRAFDRPLRALITGFLIGVLSAVVSAPVTAIVFKGVAAPSITALNVLLLSSGHSLWRSVITGALVVETIDKAIAGLLVWAVIRRLPSQMATRA
jgi:energy-coupling factor transport system substrate-specific component